MRDNSEKQITPEEFRQMSSSERIMHLSSGFIAPGGKPQQDILDTILENRNVSQPKRTLKITLYMKAAAAIVVILIGIKVTGSLFAGKEQKTANTEIAELTLPDSSTVILNAGSILKWNNKKFNEKRELQLDGEAWFDVKKGDQFIINTKNGSIEILGTQLNVFSRGRNFHVSCMSGKVRVLSNGQEQIITPGEQVKLNDAVLQMSKPLTIDNISAWKEGYCHFEQARLDVIFAEMERQFDVKILFTGKASRKATVDFSTKNIKEAIEVVCIPLELEYEFENNRTIRIEEKE